MAAFLKDNLELILMVVGGLLGALLFRSNTLGLKDKFTSVLPGSSKAKRMAGCVVSALILALVGFLVGARLKGARSGAFYHADTYETYDKLLPDDYYGMGGRMSSPINFSNAPPPAM